MSGTIVKQVSQWRKALRIRRLAESRRNDSPLPPAIGGGKGTEGVRPHASRRVTQRLACNAAGACYPWMTGAASGSIGSGLPERRIRPQMIAPAAKMPDAHQNATV